MAINNKDDQRTFEFIQSFFEGFTKSEYIHIEDLDFVRIRREGFCTFLIFDKLSDVLHNFLIDQKYNVQQTYNGKYEVTLPQG